MFYCISEKRKRKFSWTLEQEEDLIDWWRENEALYNLNLPIFHDRIRKEKIFNDRAIEIGGGCTVEDIKIHMRSLRTKLSHLLKKAPSGAEGKRLTPREKWVSERLDFIRPFMTARKAKSSSKVNKLNY